MQSILLLAFSISEYTASNDKMMKVTLERIREDVVVSSRYYTEMYLYELRDAEKGLSQGNFISRLYAAPRRTAQETSLSFLRASSLQG